eukprot:610248-Pelagomonas_calceolata.AAC.4
MQCNGHSDTHRPEPCNPPLTIKHSESIKCREWAGLPPHLCGTAAKAQQRAPQALKSCNTRMGSKDAGQGWPDKLLWRFALYFNAPHN